MLFNVSVKETLERVVTVKASTEDEAEQIVRERYYDEDIVLDANDYVDCDIESMGEADEDFEEADAD